MSYFLTEISRIHLPGSPQSMCVPFSANISGSNHSLRTSKKMMLKMHKTSNPYRLSYYNSLQVFFLFFFYHFNINIHIILIVFRFFQIQYFEHSKLPSFLKKNFGHSPTSSLNRSRSFQHFRHSFTSLL